MSGKRVALVTGAAGVMGVRLVERLLAGGLRVRGLVLPGDPGRSRLEALGARVVEGDVSDARSLRGACDGVHTVFHLAAIILSHDVSAFRRINRDGTANVVAEARAAGASHLVYVSSASVTYPRRTPYAESKLEAEHIVESSRVPYTIVRPTLVYDAGGGQELLLYLDYLKRFRVVPFIGNGSAKKRPVWAEDVVDGLARVAGNPAALGKTYNLSGAEAISMRDFSRLLLAHQGMKKQFVHLPVLACRAAAFFMGKLLSAPPLTQSAISGIVNDADLDPALAMKELGYRPLGVREGLARHFTVDGRRDGRNVRAAVPPGPAPRLEGTLQ
ncbi:MAG TPA: NAD-dependent epimerase/dehydratase family protein [Polyangiaceae bacterium]|nr:NAD-dependent epimerase/dehydratase family protein [Polyangiaceae bacterium]